MAKRVRKPKSGLEKAAAGIGRALGRAMNKIKGIDAESETAMEVRGRTLQQIGRDAGRKIATLGKSVSTPKRRTAKAATSRAGSTRGRGTRVAARKSAKRRVKKAG
jgi:hypothetical protein